MGLALLYAYRSQTQPVPEVDISKAQQDVNAGQIRSVTIVANKGTLQFKDSDTHKEQTTVPEPDTILSKTVQDYNATHLASDQVALKFQENNNSLSIVGSIVLSLLPVLLIGGFFFYMMRQAQGTNNQALSFGKSRARMFIGNKPTVTFDDVAGVEEAKQELTEVVEFLKYPEKFSSLGARIPRGVLLVGPPGTGKTMLARAVAGEAGVPFFSISGSEFVEMFVGVGASRVRDLFDQAKRNAPCIVFVDEIDAVGRQRGAGLGGSLDEREQTLNQILVEMDGFDSNTNVTVIAATNRSDREKRLTAYHEGGHAVAMRYLEHHDPVHKVTIIARGMMGGYTRPLPPEDRYYMTKSQFKASIASALGGHAAEQVVFGEISTGAENDIEKATNIARKMVKEYGMSERLGTVALGHKEELVFLGREIGEQKNYSEKTA